MEECREAGPAHVGNCFWDRLGTDDVLREAGLSDKARLLTRVMTLNRLTCPRSEHAMPSWFGNSAIADLVGAESAFRAMKSPLSERAIFHQTQKRAEAHIFLCILAYHLLIAIEKTLRDKAIHDSWATVRDMLSSRQTVTVVLPTADRGTLMIRCSSAPEPEHIRIYDALNLPHTVMALMKTWSST